MTDIHKLKALAEAATPKKWSTSGSYIAPTREESGATYVESWRSIALVSDDKDRAFIAAANPAAVLELVAEIERLRAVTRFEDAVACVFDCLKMTAANTSSREWDDLLEELAEEVIEYAPNYKKQWKDICAISQQRDQLKAENERLQRFETAYKEYSDKTDWVQETSHWSELGMHRADVLRKRVDQLKAENEALRDGANFRAIQSLRKDCEELRKDAERYRWLREAVQSDFDVSYDMLELRIATPHHDSDDLDACIDAAMSKEAQS